VYYYDDCKRMQDLKSISHIIVDEVNATFKWFFIDGFTKLADETGEYI
jgi:hypothetical protein